MRKLDDNAPDQLYIAGTEPPPDPERRPEIDEIVYSWLEGKDAQRRASEDSKLRHLVLIAKLAEAGIERYPYTDRTSGKKRYVVVKRDPKAATTKPPQVRKPKKQRTSVPPAETVEHRKVSRKSVEKEIDPFAGVRDRMESP